MLLFCAVGAALFAALYLLGRQGRRFIAWLLRQEGPRERVGAFLIIAALAGALAGGLAYQPLTAAMRCRANGQSVMSCLVAP